MRRIDKLRHIERVNILLETRHLSEKRSVSGVMNPNEDIGTLLTLLYDKYGFDNCYVSFRDTLHVGKINPNNGYNTPTGLYTYKLSNYLTRPIFNSDDFRSKFPFASNRPFAQFLIVKDDAVILNSTTPSRQLDTYVDEIGQLYKTNDSIVGLCTNWVNGTYQSYYSESQHVTHKLWLFLFDVASYLKGVKTNVFSNLCRKVGIDGFDDDECVGWIHPSEKCQTVFFRANLFKDQYELSLKRDDYDGAMRDLGVVNPKQGELSDDKILELLSRGKFSVTAKFDELVSRSKNPKIGAYLKKYVAGMGMNSFVGILSQSKSPKGVKSVMGSRWDELVPNLRGTYLDDVLSDSGTNIEMTALLLRCKPFMDGMNEGTVYRLVYLANSPKDTLIKLLDYESVRAVIMKGNLHSLLSGNLTDMILDTILSDDRMSFSWELSWDMVNSSSAPMKVLNRLGSEFTDKLLSYGSWFHNFGDLIEDMANPDEFILSVGDRLFSNWFAANTRTRDGIADAILSVNNWGDRDSIYSYVLSKDYIVGITGDNIHELLYKSTNKDKMVNIIIANDGIVKNLDSAGINALLKYSDRPIRVSEILKSKGVNPKPW